jgi:hypothetical protein
MQTHDENSDDELRFENELKRIKLNLEHGVYFSNPSDSKNTPPEVENEFLSHIEQFEKAHTNAQETTVHEFIGKPDFLKVETIPGEKIHAELKRVLKILAENNIVIDTICEVEERELYRFITEELMLAEIEDIRISGMQHHFIYEEFHPNHEHDIRERCTEFIRCYLDKKSEFFLSMLEVEAKTDPIILSFREAFDSFALEHFEITSLSFDESQATVRFLSSFSGKLEGNKEIFQFSGEGVFELKYQYEWWSIHKVVLPEKI